MPYLGMDPVDLGREHEAVIRINSQSGKVIIDWYVGDIFAIELPRELEIAFTQIVKTHANDTGLELTHNMLDKLLRAQYMLLEASGLKVVDCRLRPKVSDPSDATARLCI